MSPTWRFSSPRAIGSAYCWALINMWTEIHVSTANTIWRPAYHIEFCCCYQVACVVNHSGGAWKFSSHVQSPALCLNITGITELNQLHRGLCHFICCLQGDFLQLEVFNKVRSDLVQRRRRSDELSGPRHSVLEYWVKRKLWKHWISHVQYEGANTVPKTKYTVHTHTLLALQFSKLAPNYSHIKFILFSETIWS